MMELKESVLRDALSRAFDEGLCGYSEIKDDTVDSILSDLVSVSEKSMEVTIPHQTPYSTYCSGFGSASYSFSTSSIPSFGTVDSEEPL